LQPASASTIMTMSIRRRGMVPRESGYCAPHRGRGERSIVASLVTAQSHVERRESTWNDGPIEENEVGVVTADSAWLDERQLAGRRRRELDRLDARRIIMLDRV